MSYRSQEHTQRDADVSRGARIEALLESLPDALCAVDCDWRVNYLNRNALLLLAAPGSTRADLLGLPLWDALPDLRGGPFEQASRDALRSGDDASEVFFHSRLERWFDLRCHPAPGGMSCTFQDVTARKAEERARLDASNRLQVALAAGRLGDWHWDAHSDQVTLGARAAEIFGLAAETPLDWGQLRARLYGPDRASMATNSSARAPTPRIYTWNAGSTCPAMNCAGSRWSGAPTTPTASASAACSG